MQTYRTGATSTAAAGQMCSNCLRHPGDYRDAAGFSECVYCHTETAIEDAQVDGLARAIAVLLRNARVHAGLDDDGYIEMAVERALRFQPEEVAPTGLFCEAGQLRRRAQQLRWRALEFEDGSAQQETLLIEAEQITLKAGRMISDDLAGSPRSVRLAR